MEKEHLPENVVPLRADVTPPEWADHPSRGLRLVGGPSTAEVVSLDAHRHRRR